MPSESEFRELLDASARRATSARRLDAASIIRRSKRRRLPGQLAIGGLGTLAIAGIGVGTVTGLHALGFTTATSGVADSSAGGSESVPQKATGGEAAPSARQLNRCGEAIATVAPARSGLVLTPRFRATAMVDGRPISGTVTMTNTGEETITGTTAASPAITVSEDGIVLWHSNGPMITLARLVDLAPGESMDYVASFTPVRCGPADDRAQGFREDLPPLASGSYQISAAIDLSSENESESGKPRRELVTGPPQTVELHQP